MSSARITATLYAKVARAQTHDVDAAATAARRAFDHGPWPKMAPFERGGILRSIAEAIRSDANAIAEIETRSGGKTLANSRNEVEAAARVFDYYAGAMDKFFGETIPMGDGVLDFTLAGAHRRGGADHPLELSVPGGRMEGSAGAGGRVRRHSQACELYAAHLTPSGRLAMEAGVPDGVLNVLPGPGAQLGEHIARHPMIDKIAFTGETRTGASLLKAAADGIKRVSLELGGKSPNIVFADADLPRRRPPPSGRVWQCRSSCSARTRLLRRAKRA